MIDFFFKIHFCTTLCSSVVCGSETQYIILVYEDYLIAKTLH